MKKRKILQAVIFCAIAGMLFSSCLEKKDSISSGSLFVVVEHNQLNETLFRAFGGYLLFAENLPADWENGTPLLIRYSINYDQQPYNDRILFTLIAYEELHSFVVKACEIEDILNVDEDSLIHPMINFEAMELYDKELLSVNGLSLFVPSFETGNPNQKLLYNIVYAPDTVKTGQYIFYATARKDTTGTSGISVQLNRIVLDLKEFINKEGIATGKEELRASLQFATLNSNKKITFNSNPYFKDAVIWKRISN
ncbi:MAG: hypothetical protein LBD45_02615 [Bacteroidales bacterium]|jgi:hypothetical protein|nr:hypothetical protein [Bacteroidales bacterium]